MDLETILRMIQRQDFADWYNDGRFLSYISDSEDSGITKEDIISDLAKMLR